MCVCDYVGGGGDSLCVCVRGFCVCMCVRGFCVCYYVGGGGGGFCVCVPTCMLGVGCLLLSEEFSAPLSCTCLGQS